MRNESLVWPEVRMPGRAARGMVEQQITTTVLSFKTLGKKNKKNNAHWIECECAGLRGIVRISVSLCRLRRHLIRMN